jgi:hypothetical protein
MLGCIFKRRRVARSLSTTFECSSAALQKTKNSLVFTFKMPYSHLLLAWLFVFLYGGYQAAAFPTLVPKAVSSPSTTSPIKLLGEGPCTRATVTVVSKETSVKTKTKTVTERVVVPTRLRDDKRDVCIHCMPSTKPHSTSTTSTTAHKKATAPALAITRRIDEREECRECLTAGIFPGLLNVKTTSASHSKASTTKSSRRKSTTKAAATPTTTSWAIIHSIHFDKRDAPSFTKIAHSIHFDKKTATALPGHAELEDAPTHGE